MVTTAEGLRMFQTGAGQLGAGMAQYGQHSRRSEAAGAIREEDEMEFKGGASGREQAAAATREGQFSVAQGLRAPIGIEKRMNMLAGQIVKAKMAGDTEKATQLSEVMATYGNAMNDINLYKYAYKKNKGGGGGKRKAVEGDTGAEPVVKDAEGKEIEFDIRNPDHVVAYISKHGPGSKLSKNTMALHDRFVDNDRKLNKNLVDAKTETDKQTALENHRKETLSLEKESLNIRKTKAKKADQDKLDKEDNPMYSKKHTVMSNSEVFKDIDQDNIDDPTERAKLKENIGKANLPDYLKQSALKKINSQLDTGAQIDLAKDLTVVGPANWSKKSMTNNWDPAAMDADVKKVLKDDSTPNRIELPKAPKSKARPGFKKQTSRKTGKTYWVDEKTGKVERDDKGREVEAN